MPCHRQEDAGSAELAVGQESVLGRSSSISLLIPAINSTVVLPIVQGGLASKTTAPLSMQVARMYRNYDKQDAINFSDHKWIFLQGKGNNTVAGR